MSLRKIIWCVLAGVSLSLAGCPKMYGPPPMEPDRPEKEEEVKPAPAPEPDPGEGGGVEEDEDEAVVKPMYGVETVAE